MKLAIDTREFEFLPASLKFEEGRDTDLFFEKNNKTVLQTLEHPKYAHLAEDVRRRYSGALAQPLGEFLKQRKHSGDPFFRQFLNPYGDSTFCRFTVLESDLQKLKGLYCFCVADSLKYIGRCTDSFGKRINGGYGHIHPKNCFRDGRATNCRLNALIAVYCADTSVHVHPMDDDADIGLAEAALITKYQPEWNIQLCG